MSIDTWDEIRTAFHVARRGTVSGAAEVLGVHHATVIRHIDALERRLGVKLFQRHARGYTPTEAGRDLLQVAQATEDHFAQLAARIKGQGEAVTGELVVTSLSDITGLLTPVLIRFQEQHPGLRIRFLTDTRLFRLEYGEAHVAIRAGAAPDQADNVVQPFLRQRYALCATKDYLARHGRPRDEGDFAQHHFVAGDETVSRAPFYRWLAAHAPAEAITFRASSDVVQRDAIMQGAGLGFLPARLVRENPELEEVMSPREDWTSTLWLVTHVDLHRTNKVQSFLSFLKQEAKNWPMDD